MVRLFLRYCFGFVSNHLVSGIGLFRGLGCNRHRLGRSNQLLQRPSGASRKNDAFHPLVAPLATEQHVQRTKRETTLAQGVKIESEEPGTGDVAARGKRVVLRVSGSLRRGDSFMDGERVSFRIGKREVIAGLEYGVEGMRVGGRRRIRVPPASRLSRNRSTREDSVQCFSLLRSGTVVCAGLSNRWKGRGQKDAAEHV